MSSAKEAATIWAALVGAPDLEDAETAIAELAPRLLDFPQDILVFAGFAALDRREVKPRLPLSEWCAACEVVARGRGERRNQLSATFVDPQIALAILARDDVGRARRALGRPYRERMPLGWVPGLESIDENLLETRAALALALTSPDGQFAVDGQSAVFAGYLRGFHQEGDRTYVDGLSRALDDIGEIVYRHRHGSGPRRGGRQYAGGRFYVRPNSEVVCAACRYVITKVGARPSEHPISRCTGA
jgi:hypothetical protein